VGGVSYEDELRPLEAFVRANPGLTVESMEDAIRKAINSGDQAVPINARGLPHLSHLMWRLRYLELSGQVRQEKRKWFAI
jgi:hypothetical protein